VTVAQRSPMSHSLREISILVSLAIGASHAYGQAGPPFRSDEPGTPGNGHWEINIAGIGERNPGEGRYALPNLDFNYGLGDRIQLKYEMAYGLYEVRGSTPSLAGGIGNSLAGVKYRFFEKRASQTGDSNFALSVYPQLLFSAVNSSVRRDIADPGQFYLPFECSGRLGALTFSGELGYWFARHQVPGAWVEAAVLGHEFSKTSELFAEIYHTTDIQYGDSRRVPDLTLGVGGRKSIKEDGSLRLLAMVGHSLLPPEPTGTRPQWIAYIGLRILIGNK
jgi:hypothetical protein